MTWRNNLLEVLRQHRHAYFEAYLRCARYVVVHGFDATRSDPAADAGEFYYSKYQELDAAIEPIQAAPLGVLEEYYRLVRRAEAA